MIEPTIGRKVWYIPSLYDRGLMQPQPATIIRSNGELPCDASICYVHSSRMVNLSVVDHNGTLHAKPSVHLLQEGDEPLPEGMAHAVWMPYQISQGAKAEVKVDDATTDATPHQLQAAENKAAEDKPAAKTTARRRS